MRPFSLQQPATVAASKKWLWAKELRPQRLMPSPFWNIEEGGQCRQSRNQAHGFRVIARKKAQRVRLYR
jgi:hypothetical protein